MEAHQQPTIHTFYTLCSLTGSGGRVSLAMVLSACCGPVQRFIRGLFNIRFSHTNLHLLSFPLPWGFNLFMRFAPWLNGLWSSTAQRYRVVGRHIAEFHCIPIPVNVGWSMSRIEALNGSTSEWRPPFNFLELAIRFSDHQLMKGQ